MYSVLNRKICCRPPLLSSKTSFPDLPKFLNLFTNSIPRLFSSTGDGPNFNWDAPAGSSWSTGLTKDHFDGEAVGQQITPPGPNTPVPKPVPIPGPGPVSAPVATGNRRPQQVPGTRQKSQYWNKGSGLGGSDKREMEMALLLKQIEDPGARGSYLKDSEKAEMYKKHKADPKVYTIEKLAEEYRIMRQRVCAILWLKEDEEEEAKKRGEPLDDSIEQLIDTFPHFFNSHDREYHVASLPYKPDFKVMPEGWDGTTRDPDEVHYEISKKEDDMLYEEFCLRFNFNKMKFKNQVKVHKYSRKRPSNGWEFVVTKVGPRGKRGAGGGWNFVSQPDGSTRPLNEIEKMYVKRETPRRRRKILP